MPVAPLRIVQITDTHLFNDKKKELLGVNTQKSFEVLLNLFKADNVAPHYIFITGDLTQDGSEAAYIRLADELSVFQVPVYVIPGNHDDIETMSKVYPRKMFLMEKQLIVPGWQFILLDSHQPGLVEGRLKQTELDFLEHCLRSYPTHRAVIAFHHHPVSVGSEWLDKLGLSNAEQFWQILNIYPQVHTILFGHVHQLHEGEKNNIKYYSTPSTCIQFKTKTKNFALEKIPPAYRIIDLQDNGEIHTSVHYVEEYVGRFEKDAKGY